MLAVVGVDPGDDDSMRILAREAEELRGVEARLLRVFGATVRADDVRQCVEVAYAHYDRVRVRTYVPLLTERRAARDLRAIQQISERSA
jgi:hypothetical protein